MLLLQHLSTTTDTSGCPPPAGAYPQVKSLQLKLTLELQSVWPSNDAQALGQPRHSAMGVIKVLPGTAGQDDKLYSKQPERNKATNKL